MQELEETLKIKILEVDGKTQRLIFGAWTVDEKQMKIGAPSVTPTESRCGV